MIEKWYRSDPILLITCHSLQTLFQARFIIVLLQDRDMAISNGNDTSCSQFPPRIECHVTKSAPILKRVYFLHPKLMHVNSLFPHHQILFKRLRHVKRSLLLQPLYILDPSVHGVQTPHFNLGLYVVRNRRKQFVFRTTGVSQSNAFDLEVTHRVLVQLGCWRAWRWRRWRRYFIHLLEVNWGFRAHSACIIGINNDVRFSTLLERFNNVRLPF